MDLVVADKRTVPYIYLLNVVVAEEDLKLMKYVSKHDYSTRRKPKITGGGGRAGDARKDVSQPVPLDSMTGISPLVRKCH